MIAKALPLVLLMTLSANTCSNKDSNSSTAMVGSKWVLERLGGQVVTMPDGIEQPWLKVDGGQLQGFGGCNSLFGQVELSGSSLKFPGVASTKKYCESVQDTETAFTRMLGEVDSYKLDKGRLKLMGAGKELAELKPE